MEAAGLVTRGWAMRVPRWPLPCVLLVAVASWAGRAGAAEATVKADEYHISAAPHTHKNLSVFFIYGESKLKGGKFLTLQEAMKQKKVIVHETGNVGKLAVENLSATEAVYIQAGDIVKGGKQDRTLSVDLIVPPKSGKLPVSSFCVEAGRWNARNRGAQTAARQVTVEARFLDVTDGALEEIGVSWPTNGARAAENAQPEQTGRAQAGAGGSRVNRIAERVVEERQTDGQSRAESQRERASAQRPDNVDWFGRGSMTVVGAATSAGRGFDSSNNQLSSKQLKLAAKLKGDQGAVWAEVAKSQIKLSEKVGERVNAPESETSMQLALENKKLGANVDEYVKALSKSVEDKKGAIGFAFAINGKMNSADVYASEVLFRNLWPKLLKASAVEAVAELEKDKKHAAARAADVVECVTSSAKAESTEKRVSDRVRMTTRKSKKYVRFDTIDEENDDVEFHRNWLAY